MNRETFKHFKKGDRPSAKEYNRLVDAVSKHSSSLHVQGLVDSSGSHTRRLPSVVAEEVGIKELTGYVHIRCVVTGELYTPSPAYVRSARIQTGGVPSNAVGPFVCKLLDSDGNETGSTINVYPREHLGTNDLDSTDVHPDYAAADDIPVYEDINDVWYTMNVFEDTIDSVRTAP